MPSVVTSWALRYATLTHDSVAEYTYVGVTIINAIYCQKSTGKEVERGMTGQFIPLILCFITGILLFNCWLMRRNLHAIEAEIRLVSEALQLEIHAIRDVIEEVDKRQRQQNR